MNISSRKLVQQTLEFEAPERIPRQLWALPWAERRFPEELKRIRTQYPDDIIAAPRICRNGTFVDPPERYEKGIWIDEWGCTFENAGSGTIGIARRPLIESWDQMDRLRPPRAFLNLDRDEIAAFCRSRDPFILSGTWIRPFERLQFLRTTEQTMMDLAERPDGFCELLLRIHQFNLDEAESWARTEVDALTVMDDWGSQASLLIDPALWRLIFKPLYREYAAVARHFRKKIFIHSDGFILDIIGDLLEIGYDAVNSQIFCMGVERLRPFRGKITFWGEIDRQNILPYGTAAEVETAVRSVYDHLYLNGGVIAQCEFGPGAKPENVELVFRTWEALRGAAVTADSGNGIRR